SSRYTRDGREQRLGRMSRQKGVGVGKPGRSREKTFGEAGARCAGHEKGYPEPGNAGRNRASGEGPGGGSPSSRWHPRRETAARIGKRRADGFSGFQKFGCFQEFQS